MLRQIFTGISPVRRSASSFISKLTAAVDELPMREAVRYKAKNMKWTAKNIQDYSDSHANALSEFGLQSGDTIAIWMHDCAEKHTSMLAAAKLGLRIAEIDPDINTVEHIREALKVSQCKTIVFAPTFNDQNYLLLLRKAIPEFYEYDDTFGQHFHSKHFPYLKSFVHTGFDTELGAQTYKSLFLSESPQPNAVTLSVARLTDSIPVYFHISKSGPSIAKSAVVTHAELSGHPQWTFANNLVSMKYFECEN